MPVPGPDTRVVELRVHGGGPGSAEALLDAVTAVDVAGDGAGRFVRPADRLRRPAPGPVLAGAGRSTPRIVEGYLPAAPGSWLLAVCFPFCLAGVASLMAPAAVRGVARWLVRLAGVLLGLLLLAVLAALVAPAALRLVPLVVALGLLAVCAMVALVVTLGAVSGRDTEVPSVLRPWAGGVFSAVVLMLAVFLGFGFGAVLGQLRAWLFGGTLPAGYAEAGLVWLFASAATALVALLAAGVSWLRGRGTPPVEVALLQTEATARRAAGAWRLASWQRGVAHRLVLLLAVLLVLGAGLVALLPVPGGYAVNGFVVLCLIALALVRLAWLPAARLGTLGTMVRLAAPGEFSAAAVADVVARAEVHLAEPHNRVVLTGEGHGSLVAALAALRLVRAAPEAERARLGLVVAGSGVQWLYPRALPSVFGYPELVELAKGLGERWRSLCRGTDPAGGAVTTWRRQRYDDDLLGSGLLAEGGCGALPPAASAPTGALVLGGDHWLPDPAPGPITGRRWIPGLRAHAEYVAEEEWDRAVAVAAGLESALAVQQAALFRLPAKWSAGGRAHSA